MLLFLLGDSSRVHTKNFLAASLMSLSIDDMSEPMCIKNKEGKKTCSSKFQVACTHITFSSYILRSSPEMLTNASAIRQKTLRADPGFSF